MPTKENAFQLEGAQVAGLKLYAGTNAPQGGANSRTQLEIFLDPAKVEIDLHAAGGKFSKIKTVEQLRLLFSGDDSARALVSLLRHAADTIEVQLGEDAPDCDLIAEHMQGFEGGFSG